jgi:hypothetical protein
VKVIIAGSRTLTPSNQLLTDCITASGFDVEEIVEGGSAGVDKTAEAYGIGSNISVRTFPANWNKYGRAAGPRRNREMAEYADALILVWDGYSRGSASMKREADRAGIPVYEHIVE